MSSKKSEAPGDSAPSTVMTAYERGIKASAAREAARPAAPTDSMTKFAEELGSLIYKRNIADKDKFKNFKRAADHTKFTISARDVLSQASEEALSPLKGKTISYQGMFLRVKPDYSIHFIADKPMSEETAERMFNDFGYVLLRGEGKFSISGGAAPKEAAPAPAPKKSARELYLAKRAKATEEYDRLYAQFVKVMNIFGSEEAFILATKLAAIDKEFEFSTPTARAKIMGVKGEYSLNHPAKSTGGKNTGLMKTGSRHGSSDMSFSS